MKTLKSKTFASEFFDYERLKKDLTIISKIDSQNLMEISKFLSEGTRLLERLTEEEVSVLSSKVSVAPPELLIAYAIGRLMVRSAIDHEDKLEDIIHDLDESKLLPENTEEKDRIIWYLKSFEPILEYLEKEKEVFQTAASVIPIVDQIEYVVDMRIQFDKVFDPLTQNIDSYKPSPNRVVPVIIFTLSARKKPDREIIFQLNKEGLTRLINSFKAAAKDLDEITAKISENDLDSIKKWVVGNKKGRK